MPTTSNAMLLECARTATTIPAGEYWFKPPLVLEDVPSFCGTPGRTTLRPMPDSTAQSHPLIVARTTQPGSPITGLPRPLQIAHLTILGRGPVYLEYGLQMEGAEIDVKHVAIVENYIGIVGKWMVDCAFYRVTLRRNACNIYIPGSGPNTITHTSWTRCQIRESYGTGALIQNGLGLSFPRSVFESNAGMALDVRPGKDARVKHLQLPGTWFEGNAGGDIHDPTGAVVSHDTGWFERLHG